MIKTEERSFGLVVKDGKDITCLKDGNILFIEKLNEYECKPFILPIFPESYKAVIGHNLTWLCKTVGSEAGTIAWSIPNGQILSEGECFEERHCARQGKLSLDFLHPTDAGGYSCAAKNKHGNSSRKVYLEVKVIDKFQVLFNK